MSLRKLLPYPVPGNWRKAIWPGFELCVIRLVCEACVRLRTDNRRRADWEERQYSWAVHRHLENLCLEQNLSFSPRYDLHELTEDDFAAGVSPKTAALLDLCIRWHQHIPEVRFAIEAKILVVKTRGSYYPGGCRNEYVNKGMKRFFEGRYGQGMPSGAMLGYILDGTAAEVVPKISAQITEEASSNCEAMPHVETPFEGIVRHTTTHMLNDNLWTRLHHVFVEQAAIQEAGSSTGSGNLDV